MRIASTNFMSLPDCESRGDCHNSGTGGTSDYRDLTQKPKINNVELVGNKNSTDLGLQEKLKSGMNIKTIGGVDLLGEGDVPLTEGSVLDIVTIEDIERLWRN